MSEPEPLTLNPNPLSRFQHSPSNAMRFKAHAQRFCAEQIVCFYHKDAEAYLDYRTTLGLPPTHTATARVWGHVPAPKLTDSHRQPRVST